jgi:hypothetical protein
MEGMVNWVGGSEESLGPGEARKGRSERGSDAVFAPRPPSSTPKLLWPDDVEQTLGLCIHVSLVDRVRKLLRASRHY